MKLHGMFMIIPLLAVVASGSTIPSTDSYNVQRLEKRGNDDPASRNPALRIQGLSWQQVLESKEVLNLKFRTDIWGPSPIGNKDEKGNPVGSTNPFDSNYRPPHFGNKDKKKTPVESLNALESGHTSQTIVKENEKGESTKSPNSLKLGPEAPRNL
ncbi:hypothetical protein BASA60_003060 [Batrachochytrium salamandrivorans]|nr:hypothetical protein BASA60_003060 [Batrachochytrium salamandrivorans]